MSTDAPARADLVANLRLADNRQLASGIDGLYLSGRCDVPAALWGELLRLKEVARDTERSVPVPLGAEVLAVSEKAFGRYRVRLEHEWGIVGVTDSAKLPSLRFQPRAEYLHAVGVGAVVEWFRQTFTPLSGELFVTVARIDLFVDQQSWVPRESDRHRMVSRARKIDTHEDSGQLTGFSIGRRASGLTARIYDKTAEIAHTHNVYWLELWGDERDPSAPVWRTEFEFGRAALRSFELDTPENVLDAKADLWRYATEDWLTLRDPSGDATRSRWAIASEWAQVQRVAFTSPLLGIQRMREVKAAGSMEKLLPLLFGSLTSYGALLGAETIDEVLDQIPDAVRRYGLQRGTSFERRIEEKREQARWS